jgi:hypothetical protein
MTKSTITRLFVGSVVAVVAGVVLAFVAVIVAFAGGAFVMDGPDVTGVAYSPFAWSMIGLMGLAGLTILAGFLGGLVSWIGALLNTAQLTDKTWFLLLLVLGIFSFGLVAMIAYVLAGPDGMRHELAPTA